MDRVDKHLVKGDIVWAKKELHLEEGVMLRSGGSGLAINSAWINTMSLPKWDDLRVPVNAVKLGGALDPVYEQFQDDGAGSTGVFTYAFIHTADRELFFAVQFPHDIVLGSAIYPHVHWSPETAAAGVVRWGLEYSWASIDSDFGNTATITADRAVDTEASKHILTSFDMLTTGSHTISSMMLCRIYRDTTVGSNYGAKAYLHEIDFHYQRGGFGTNTPSM